MGVDGVDALLASLTRRGYTVIGPTMGEGAIVYGPVASTADLPVGWTDVQEPGSYRLRRRTDSALFGYAVGPHSWKQFLFPPRSRLWRASRTDDGGFGIDTDDTAVPRFAFIGVRACELAALAVHDRVFAEGGHPDATYVNRRAGSFVVAVSCTSAAATCFCASMGTGPAVDSGYDLALTEIVDGTEHRFVATAGSAEGADVLGALASRPARPDDDEAAAAGVARAAAAQVRSLDAHRARETVLADLEHPQWDDVAERCLACANCTMVCPTCFCNTFEDVTDLAGEHTERWRSWDSCFTLDFSAMHGGSIRPSVRSRYRQWLTHKVGTWWDQFGTSGCVGCGRCITWCPVGIDLTAEIAALANPSLNRQPAAARGARIPVEEAP